MRTLSLFARTRFVTPWMHKVRLSELKHSHPRGEYSSWRNPLQSQQRKVRKNWSESHQSRGTLAPWHATSTESRVDRSCAYVLDGGGGDDAGFATSRTPDGDHKSVENPCSSLQPSTQFQCGAGLAVYALLSQGSPLRARSYDMCCTIFDIAATRHKLSVLKQYFGGEWDSLRPTLPLIVN